MTNKVQRYIAQVAAALLMGFFLYGTVGAESIEPSIYYRELPAGLQSRVAESLSALAKAYPMSADAKEAVTTTLQGMASDPGPRNRQCAEKIKAQGQGAVIVLVDSLESQDDQVRKKVLWCLAMFESHGQDSAKAEAPIDETLVLLYYRSLMDRSVEIRRLAATRLFAVGKEWKANPPSDVELALKKAASSDPDADVRKLADRLLATLEAISRRTSPPKYSHS
ncbi:MAG: hypothetical protein ACYC64_03965 [Armatimonadota bacterium]